MSKNHKIVSRLLIAAGLTVSTSAALGQDFYVSGTLGLLQQGDSSNSGTFTSNFTTGTVTGVNPPLNIPNGSPVGWNTQFDRGINYGVAVGTSYAGFRFELEYRESDADVDTHRGVSAAGINLSGIDAGVLIGGNVGDLGVSVAGLVDAGQGQLETSSVMINAFYDFDLDNAFTPYIGIGIGNANSDVVYAPSNTPVLNGRENGFAWQVIGGVSYELTDTLDLFANYRYFSAEDFSVRSSLLPATFKLENNAQSLDVGIRFSF
jgi:opacity protein-like surface antigen